MKTTAKRSFSFSFGEYPCLVEVGTELPELDLLRAELAGTAWEKSGVLLVCDPNTQNYARTMMATTRGSSLVGIAVLECGEAAKAWPAVENILLTAAKAGFGRDVIFVGIGGGVICDLTAFAASVYMRGVRLALVPTTLLAMVDAAVGGKTGFDLWGIKNLVGTFRPAEQVRMPVSALSTLPRREYLSGLAELIKTAIIGDENLLDLLETEPDRFAVPSSLDDLTELVALSVGVKGVIVQADPRETGTQRALLNLGHTFGHALEAVAGLGVLTHGEAVAWGMSRACTLGVELGLTPVPRAQRINAILATYGYETGALHPVLLKNKPKTDKPDYTAIASLLLDAMASDKKKKGGELRFIVPGSTGALLATASTQQILACLEIN